MLSIGPETKRDTTYSILTREKGFTVEVMEESMEGLDLKKTRLTNNVRAIKQPMTSKLYAAKWVTWGLKLGYLWCEKCAHTLYYVIRKDLSKGHGFVNQSETLVQNASFNRRGVRG